MSKRKLSGLIGSLAILALSPAGRGAYLDPGAFASLGTLNLGSGNYTIDTNGAPTLRDSLNNVLYVGTTYVQGAAFDNTISVLDFSSITLATGANVSVTGANPLALLSRSDAVIAGLLTANGLAGHPSNAAINPGDGLGGVGGPGAGKGADGTGASPGQTGQGPGGGPGGIGGIGVVQAGGGSFGGKGGQNAAGASSAPYGDLNLLLQAGSGGGATGTSAFESIGGGGGGGGGAVELGALGSITFFGPGGVHANGGNSGSGFAANAGAGSGGGLLIHAPTIDLEFNSTLYAQGGAAFGGGGRILFLTDTATIRNAGGTISAAAGGGINNQTDGVVEFGFLNAVPEPSSMMLIVVAGLAAARLPRARRRRN